MPKTMEQTKNSVEELLETIVVEQRSLVLHNDDHNTFDWVIESLIDICDHHPTQAEQCSLIIHFKGKCAVKMGVFEKLRPLKDALIDRGLSATID